MRVDLGRAFNHQPRGQATPSGWELDTVVDGELTAWHRDTHGRWWGEVRLCVQRGANPHAGGVRHVWWLPAHCIAPA